MQPTVSRRHGQRLARRWDAAILLLLPEYVRSSPRGGRGRVEWNCRL